LDEPDPVVEVASEVVDGGDVEAGVRDDRHRPADRQADAGHAEGFGP